MKVVRGGGMKFVFGRGGEEVDVGEIGDNVEIKC